MVKSDSKYIWRTGSNSFPLGRFRESISEPGAQSCVSRHDLCVYLNSAFASWSLQNDPHESIAQALLNTEGLNIRWATDR